MQMDFVPQRYNWFLSSGEDDLKHYILLPHSPVLHLLANSFWSFWLPLYMADFQIFLSTGLNILSVPSLINELETVTYMCPFYMWKSCFQLFEHYNVAPLRVSGVPLPSCFLRPYTPSRRLHHLVLSDLPVCPAILKCMHMKVFIVFIYNF